MSHTELIVTMENSPICAPEPEFLLAPAMGVPSVKSKQIMAVPWAVGLKDAEQPPSPGLQIYLKKIQKKK